MRMEGDENWIDAEIERELASLVDDFDDYLDDTPEDAGVSTEITESNDEFYSFLKKYEDRTGNVLNTIDGQLKDVDSILGQNSSVKDVDYDEEIRDAAESRGIDVETFSEQILSLLQAEDEQDGRIVQKTPDESVSQSDDVVPEISPESGALVVFCESDELELKFREQMEEWSRLQKEKENSRTVESEQQYSLIKDRLNALEAHRKNLLESMKQEEISLEEVKTLRAAEIDIECSETLKKDQAEHDRMLKELDTERNSQKRYIEDLKTEAQSIENAKNHNAATKIQSLWRGFQARQEFGETVQEWIQHGKKKREERRLREIENERIKRKTEERKQIEEEQKESRKLEMERLKEEERLRREEKERLKKIENDKIEAEKKRKRDEEREREIEKERIKMLEEERKAKEAIRREQERKLKEEAERKRLEERRINDEQRASEESEKRAEEKRLEELRRVEEEKRKQEELEKIEQEKKNKEAELKKKEEERKAEVLRLKKLEETRKKEERRKEEERKKAELETKKLAEERELERMAKEKFDKKFGVEVVKSESVVQRGNYQNFSEVEVKPHVSEPAQPSHAEILQRGRLAWMQSCIPLSKLLMEAKSRKALPSTIPKRRPSSNKKLTPIPESAIFSDGLTDSYEEVFTLTLANLPAYNIQPLALCVNLTTVEIRNCHVVILDAFEKCPKLRSLICGKSKVEVVNLRNLNELVYLDLSENQISSIHGLDGCSDLRVLDLHKNRITRVENLCHLTNLHTLNLSQNSISRTNNISEAPTIQILDLSRNNIRKVSELEKLSLLRHLDLSHNSLDSVPVLTNHVLLEKLNLQNNGLADIEALGVFWLPLLEEINIANNSVEKFPRLDSTISLAKLNLSDNCFGVLNDFLPNLINCKVLETLNVTGNPVVELTPNMRDLVKTALPMLKNIDSFEIKSKFCHQIDSEFFKICANQLTSRRKLEACYETTLGRIVSRNEPELVPPVRRQFYEKSHKMATDFRYAHEYGDMTIDPPNEDVFRFEEGSTMSLRSETPAPLKKRSSSELKSLSKTNIVDARSKFEMALGPKPVAQSVSGSALSGAKSVSKVDRPKLTARECAAVRIQALWRGYICRKRLTMACDFANMDFDLDNFDEVDMENWDLDEGALDQEWMPSDNPTMIVSNSPVLKPIQPGPPKEAWQKIAAKPPPSPAPSSDLDTNRTKASKSEQLSEDWGFKDSRTADMMMRRAKKLKYDALKKKRLAQLDPKQRLTLIRKLEESTHLPAVQPPRRQLRQRKDYFRAKEEELERERLESAAESKNKMHRMYEWLHTNNVDVLQETHRTTTTTVSHKPPLATKRDWGGSEGSLPKLDGKGLASPGFDHVSLHSMDSDRSSRRFSHDGVLNKKIPFPPIKNNSAPSAQRQASPDPGWGGGKKRNAKR